MRELFKKILMFFCRDVGENSVDKEIRQAFLIQGHIMQTTHKPGRSSIVMRK